MITESEIYELLKKLIEKREIITLREFIDDIIKENFVLDKSDIKISTTRPNEEMYEQRVRNLISHKNLPENVEYKNETFYKKK